MLLLGLMDPIASLGLLGLDLEAVLLGCGREEAPDRMFLPIRGFLDLGQRCSLGPPDQSQDHGALALGARRAGFLGVGGHGAFLPPFAAFWPLGAPFFWVVPLFEEAFSGAT